jgi:hypothetical protein
VRQILPRDTRAVDVENRVHDLPQIMYPCRGSRACPSGPPGHEDRPDQRPRASETSLRQARRELGRQATIHRHLGQSERPKPPAN